MAINFFVGIPVTDIAVSRDWYERLLGMPPALDAGDEVVWDVAEHRSLYIALRPEHAGHALFSLFVDDLDDRADRIAERGIEPESRETYPDGVRKLTYRDPDGNEIGLGAMPAAG